MSTIFSAALPGAPSALSPLGDSGSLMRAGGVMT